jgi:cyanophycin synthetase
MDLDLEDLADRESREFPGFNDRLLNLLPGLRDHHCGPRRPGGFVYRLETGTYFGHIIEHVALDMSEDAGIPVTYGKTVLISSSAPSVYRVAVEFKSEAGMRELLRAAVDLVQAVLRSESFPLRQRIADAREIVARTALGPSTSAIVNAATRRGIPHFRLDDRSLVQLGYGKHRQVVEATMGSRTSAVAVDIVGDKQLTKTILKRAFIAVPEGRVIDRVEDAIAFLKELDRPIAVKPVDGHQGLGVSVGVKTDSEVARAFACARRIANAVLVEEYLPGRDYRILVVGDRVVAASERRPPVIVGDGARSVRALIEELNSDPRRGEGHGKPLTRIEIDDPLEDLLAIQRVGLDDIPATGTVIRLRTTANLSTGGTAIDVTSVLHPATAALCVRAARIAGLDICGVDLVTPDITRPIPPGQPAIIELNASPGIRMHQYPAAGEARDAGDAIVAHLFPMGSKSRIPIVSITGTNGKTTVTRMIAEVLKEHGLRVGMTSTDGVAVDGRIIARGDMTGARSARAVLCDPAVEVAVLETARGGIMRQGLGYDWSDVGVITNVQLDHLGQDGIESIEDLVHVKALVAERVRKGGHLVLNADDPHSAAMASRSSVAKVPRLIVFYSTRKDHLVMRHHLDAGGTGYLVENEWVVEARGATRHRVLPVAAVPATMSGHADFNVSNLLAAVACCRALNVPPGTIAAALARFENGKNPGRASAYAVRGGFVLLDYGHNPAAFGAVASLVSSWNDRFVTGVVGVPGDRDEAVIVEAGRVVAEAFDRIIIREDDDRRGREIGKAAQLLHQTVKHQAPRLDCSIVLDEAESFRTAIRSLRRGDVAVLFYDKLSRAVDILAEFGARPIQRIPPRRSSATASWVMRSIARSR